MLVKIVILGQPASMKNRRKLIPNPRKPGRFIPVLNKEAEIYLRDLRKQVPVRQPLLAGPLRARITIYYATNRPDLDESIILDGLQGRLYLNDRQVREKHVYHAIDKHNPRAIVILEEMALPLFGAQEAA